MNINIKDEQKINDYFIREVIELYKMGVNWLLYEKILTKLNAGSSTGSISNLELSIDEWTEHFKKYDDSLSREIIEKVLLHLTVYEDVIKKGGKFLSKRGTNLKDKVLDKEFIIFKTLELQEELGKK